MNAADTELAFYDRKYDFCI